MIIIFTFRKQHKNYKESQPDQYDRKTAREAQNSLTGRLTFILVIIQSSFLKKNNVYIFCFF